MAMRFVDQIADTVADAFTIQTRRTKRASEMIRELEELRKASHFSRHQVQRQIKKRCTEGPSTAEVEAIVARVLRDDLVKER